MLPFVAAPYSRVQKWLWYFILHSFLKMCRHMLYAKQCDRPGSGGEGQTILNTKCVLKMDTCSSILYVGSRGPEEVWMRSRGSPNSGAEDMRKLHGIPETSSQILGWVLQIIVRGTAMLVITTYVSLSAVGLQCCHLFLSIFLCFHFILFIRKEKKWPYLCYCLLFIYPLCLSNRKKEFQLHVNNKCTRLISRR